MGLIQRMVLGHILIILLTGILAMYHDQGLIPFKFAKLSITVSIIQPARQWFAPLRIMAQAMTLPVKTLPMNNHSVNLFTLPVIL